MDKSSDRTLIAMEIVEDQLRPQLLSAKVVCRFCLTHDAPLRSIFAPQGGNKKPKTPLTVQIMACVGIEVYNEDGMPGMICENCHVLMNCCYQFKQICKNADENLKSFLSFGIWPEKIDIPKELMVLVQTAKQSTQKLSPNVNAIINDASPPNETEKGKGKKVNVIKLSPTDLKTLKLGQKITTINPETPPAVGKKMERNLVPAVPLQTSTPIPNRLATNKLSREGSTAQLHESSRKQADQQQNKSKPDKQDTKSPVILNNLAKSIVAQKVHEEFVTTGDGTVEMILKFDQESPETVVSEKIFPCTECYRTFKLKQLLDIHKLNHKRERNNPCDLCDKRFFNKYDLAKHMPTHTGERPYVCVICRAAFSRSTLLTRHQASHKDDLTHPCMFCDRVFVSQEELAKHALNHKKLRPFKCSCCPKSFAYKQGLERHEVVHKKDFPFKCNYCKMSFRTPGMLSRHLTAHAGSRPYPCRLCKKSFLMSHHLSRHLRAHNTTGQSAYKCTDCSETFNDKTKLIQHSANHATQSLVCPLCREQFDDVKAVTQHIQMHASSPPFECDYCDLMYTSEEKLFNHCQELHTDELAYEWSDEQQMQLDQEEQDALNDDDKRLNIKCEPAGKTQIMIDGEEVEADLLLECGTAQGDYTGDNSSGDQEADNKTAFYMDQCEQQQIMETEYVEIEEYREPSSNEASPSPREASPASREASPSETIKEANSLPSTRKEQRPTTPIKMSRQQSMDNFIKRNQDALEKRTVQRTVSEMLKNLPKGMTIKRESTVPSLTAPGTSRITIKATPAVERKQPDTALEKAKVSNRDPPTKGPSKQAETINLKKPVKIEQNMEKSGVKRANASIPVKQLRKATTKEETLEGGLKRSGTMNFPKTKIKLEKPEQKVTTIAETRPMQMVRRSYAGVALAKRPVGSGSKRLAEREPADSEIEIPSKKPAPSRQTLNPATLAAARTKLQKTAMPQDGEDHVTTKRVPNSAASVGAPVEMNVGGRKIKMHKVTLSKNEALALQQAGNMKSKT